MSSFLNGEQLLSRNPKGSGMGKCAGRGVGTGAKAAGPACGRGTGIASRVPSRGTLGSIQWLLDHWKVKLRNDLDKYLVMRSDSGSM